MTIDINVPEAGESITQVELAKWLVEDGAYVEKDQEIAEIDSDKATMTINAEASGKITITVEEGATVEPGKRVGTIDTEAAPPADKKAASQKQERQRTTTEKSSSGQAAREQSDEKSAAAAAYSAKQQDKEAAGDTGDKDKAGSDKITFSPQAQKLLEEEGLSLDWDTIRPDSKRITKKDILAAIASKAEAKGDKSGSSGQLGTEADSRKEDRREDHQKMSTLRKKVSERLVAVKNETAMLTTFNEADMSAILQLRKKHQKQFEEANGFKLGFMSFFVKAITESIRMYPNVNGSIDGNQIVVPNYADVGIAVSTPKGLMVPVIRDADKQSIRQLEQSINALAEKARNNKISIEDLSGGTISITNGGVFGSMLSTPILNPPQSAILGMHKITERPVAIEGKVEIRPMMYLALSYDHRIIDGKESVGFLVSIKEMIENPGKMLMQGKDPAEVLIGL
ncbi:MAG: 2-oxoglutarate dehydrogenase complex dihydrolipoyllysine-residue succinyltransferase [Bacteroidales bacterium]